MSLATSKMILKIFGIFSIICGIFVIIIGVLALVGTFQLSPEELASDPNLRIGMGSIAVLFITGLISLLEGIFSIRGAKNAAKIMPAWIFAIIGVITAVFGLFGGGSMGGSVTTLIINIVIFIAANKIKKSRISS